MKLSTIVKIVWIIVLVLVTHIVYFVSPEMAYFIILETVLLVPAIIGIKARSDKNIVSAKVAHRRLIMVGKHRYGGTSFGWRGGFRSYWMYEEVPSYVEVWVDAVYKDGKQRRLFLREGSQRYYRIMSICNKSGEP